MKLIMTTAAAALISTAAVADNSTRHNDIFLDTSVNSDASDVYGNSDRMRNPHASTKANDIMLNTADTDKNRDTVMSTRNALRSPGEGYVYGGFGPGNDSK
ncbi:MULTISPECIES: hypothetical protein [Sulfitobacter]|uniref:hypothetical protein n=1 Tax=Sulfitobacter TaxID=60136 RepID=UPI0023073335|nr:MULTISPECIES: hypothetical protein [Sulfitobacter]MDF3383338.1 hypothetical protein [Sulfitobacter sp. Ks11]MDF3386757.1 hypothetical protein [Sulfitobacter sp. M85]MDF3390176.1 hypothetical protein [Sulfitobacter sp. Ks16]MDF3400813.1 hypothetical protein [Sulfitobacter sp. KE39]MDF3404234.1 hypothetical protein [Sulfitobacter sp. Ks35]